MNISHSSNNPLIRQLTFFEIKLISLNRDFQGTAFSIETSLYL